jgi:hypothetical protein
MRGTDLSPDTEFRDACERDSSLKIGLLNIQAVSWPVRRIKEAAVLRLDIPFVLSD